MLLAVPDVGAHATDRSTQCQSFAATIVGTDHRDTLRGTAALDVIAGLGGNDRIKRVAGGDLVCGGGGRDKVRMRPETVPVAGAVRRNQRDPDWPPPGLAEAGGHLLGGSGDDSFVITCPEGAVSPEGVLAPSIVAGPGNDFFQSTCSYDDGFSGGDGDDKAITGSGHDIVGAGNGDDVIIDRYSVGDECDPGNPYPPSSSYANVCISMGLGLWYRFEDSFNGGDGDDLIIGGDGNDEISGDDGDDDLRGGPGHDALWGEEGYDVCDGGPGDLDGEGSIEEPRTHEYSCEEISRVEV
jgi:Ca2+-binding RTX toxin-like protein